LEYNVTSLSIIKGIKIKNQKCHSNGDLEKCTKQLVEIVEMSVKYHLSQEMINQFIVMIVSRIINQKEVKEVVEDLEVEVQAVMEETTAVVEDLEEIEHLEKCTKQLVEIVEMSVKYHLSQEMINQFIVMIVFQIIKEINYYATA